MRLGFLLSLAFVAVGCQLLATPIKVEKLQLDFKNGAGTASASFANFELEGQHWNFTDADFDVRQIDGVLTIERPQDNFTFALDIPLFADVETATTSNVMLENAPGKLVAKIDRAEVQNSTDKTLISKLDALCTGVSTTPSPIDNCMNKAKLTLALLDTDGHKENGARRSLNISNISGTVSKGSLDFKIRVDGKNLDGEGRVTHDAASETIKVYIEKVKWSFIGVTGEFFDRIRPYDGDFIEVKKPYIIIHYGKQ